MTPPPAPDRFPRFALLVRYAFKAEQSLGSLPWVMLASVVGAVVAAAVAVEFASPETVQHGRIIDGSSYLHVFWVAALGAFADVLFVILLAALWNVWRYRTRADPSFATDWGLNPKPLRDLTESEWRRRQSHDMATVFLNATDVPPLDPATTLGPVKGIARLPDQSLFRMPPHGMGIDNKGLWFHPIRGGAVAPEGRYEVRWYGRWGNQDYEIGKSVHEHKWQKPYTPEEVAAINTAAVNAILMRTQGDLLRRGR